MKRLHPQVEAHVVSILNRYGFAYLAGNHLQDIVNYIWRDLLENISKYEKGDFKLWFAFRRVKRVIDYLRKEVKHLSPLPDADSNRETADSSPSHDPQARLLSGQLLERIEELPPKYSLVLKLYYWEELSYKEIAELLGMRHNSIGSLHTRALRKLEKRLNRNHGDPR